MQFETNALHAGHDVSKTQGTRAVPIYQSTSFVFDNAEHAANLFGLKEFGFIYTRLNNPTIQVLADRLNELHGGVGASVFASGTAATLTALTTITKVGDHIVSSSALYGGTFNLLHNTLPRFGITSAFVDPNNVGAYESAICENTKLIFLETLSNPSGDIPDIEAIAGVAQKHGIPLIVDNTILTPYLHNPFDYGASIAVYSLTKFIGGQGNSMGGAIVDSGKFDWTNGKFPEFSEPNPSYHGLRYSEALGPAAYVFKTILEGLRDLGGAISPANAFHILQGLETLPVRMDRHSANALEIAQWLEGRDEVSWVNYPKLASHRSYGKSKKYAPNGASGVLSFGVKKGYEHAKRIVDSVRVFSLLANIGDTKSLIIHPASTTHQQLSDQEQQSSGVTKDLVRLSVGLENIEDLKADLAAAFEA